MYPFLARRGRRAGPTSRGTAGIRSFLLLLILLLPSVVQAQTSPCTYAISPTEFAIERGTGSGRVTITTQPDCPWEPVTDAGWLQFYPLTPSRGSGTLSWMANAQNSVRERRAIVSIGDQSFTVTQAPCSFRLATPDVSVPSRGVLDAPFHIVGLEECSWTAVSNDPWISAYFRWGPPRLTYDVERNPNFSPRIGTVDVGGLTFTVVQEAATRSDVNDDGYTDLVLQHDVAGDPSLAGKVGVWFMNGEVRTGAGLFVPDGEADLNWRVATTADFDRDGRTDLLFRHWADGRMMFWRLNNEVREGTSDLGPATTLRPALVTVPDQALPDADWRLAGSADFNGDDMPDLLFQHDISGDMMVWLLANDGSFTPVETRFLNPRTAGPRWKIRGVGDIDGDGYPDLIWQDAIGGWVATWFMMRLPDGTITYKDTRWLTQPRVADLAWKIAAVADFNNDSRADIVWQHETDGWLAIWLMWDNIVLDTRFLSVSRMNDTGWKIVGSR